MRYTYEVSQDKLGGTNIIRIDEGGVMASIPADPANSDYQRYLRWVENPDAEELTAFPVTPPNYEQTQEGAK